MKDKTTMTYKEYQMRADKMKTAIARWIAHKNPTQRQIINALQIHQRTLIRWYFQVGK
jgi:predicted XRE-type DNA-binding protein